MTNVQISERTDTEKRAAPRPKLGLKYGGMKPSDQPQQANAAA